MSCEALAKQIILVGGINPLLVSIFMGFDDNNNIPDVSYKGGKKAPDGHSTGTELKFLMCS